MSEEEWPDPWRESKRSRKAAPGVSTRRALLTMVGPLLIGMILLGVVIGALVHLRIAHYADRHPRQVRQRHFIRTQPAPSAAASAENAEQQRLNCTTADCYPNDKEAAKQ
jgi:hypothetical protein